MAMPSARGKTLKHAQAAKTCSRSGPLDRIQPRSSAIHGLCPAYEPLPHERARWQLSLAQRRPPGSAPRGIHAASAAARALLFPSTRTSANNEQLRPAQAKQAAHRHTAPRPARCAHRLRQDGTGEAGEEGKRCAPPRTRRCAVHISPETWFPPLLASLAPHLRGGVGPTAVPMGYEGTLAPPDGVTALDCVSCAATRAEVRFSPKS